MANQRQGTAKSKERSEISGSTRKLGRQKGGGGARPGDINSPLLRGGGRVFGPKPRDYGFKLNKKVKILARKSALSYKVQENALLVLEDFNFEAPKTKEMVKMLAAVGAEKKALIVLPEVDTNVIKSASNIPGVDTTIVTALNVYDMLNHTSLILTQESANKIQEVYV